MLQSNTEIQTGSVLKSGLFSSTFLILWAGLFVSLIGDGLYSIGLITYVASASQSWKPVANVQVCIAGSQLVIGLLAGVFADRLDRRKLMIIADIGRAIILVFPIILLSQNRLQIWHTYVIGALLSAFGAFYLPSFYSSLPNLVATGQLTRANSIIRFTVSTGTMLGLTLGGIIVARYGVRAAISLDSISFLIAAAALMIIRFKSRSAVENRPAFWTDFAAGLRYLFSVPLFLGFIVFFVTLNFFLAPSSVTIPAMAMGVFKAGSTGYGYLRSALQFGALVGSILLVSLGDVRHKGRTILMTATGLGLMLIVFGFSRQLPMAIGAIAILGLLTAGINVLVPVIFQTHVPNEMRGRALSTLWSLNDGLRPLSIFLAGPLVDRFRAPAVVVATGILCIVCSLAGWLIKPLRRV